MFHEAALLPLDDVIKELLKLSIEFDNTPSNTKYCVQMMLRELQETPRGKKFLECQTLEEIWWAIWDICTELRAWNYSSAFKCSKNISKILSDLFGPEFQ